MSGYRTIVRGAKTIKKKKGKGRREGKKRKGKERRIFRLDVQASHFKAIVLAFRKRFVLMG